ncbi:MAG: OsmC family protein [Gemmatimonadota bacterium]|jgi:uncharacterized OsmC-like protein
MEIHLTTDHSIRLADTGEGFAFEPGEASSLSPFHLLAASLATCTYSVLVGYAEHAGLPADGLGIDVSWELDGDPLRVTRMDMALEWPGLPETRRSAAVRAASHCTIHHTLERGSRVETRVR